MAKKITRTKVQAKEKNTNGYEKGSIRSENLQFPRTDEVWGNWDYILECVGKGLVTDDDGKPFSKLRKRDLFLMLQNTLLDNIEGNLEIQAKAKAKPAPKKPARKTAKKS